MLRWILPFAFLASPVLAAQPADGWRAAWQDIQRVAPQDRPYTRYVWMGLDADPKLRSVNYLVLCGHLQGLSRNRRIVPPVAVLEDGSGDVERLVV